MENKTSRKKATPEKPSRPNPAYKYSSIAIKMIVIILAGTLGGMKIGRDHTDRNSYFHINPFVSIGWELRCGLSLETSPSNAAIF